MPLQAFLTIMVAFLAGGVAAVNQRQNIMGEVFGTAAIVVCGFTITVYALWPVTPNTALPLTLVILTTYLLVAWTHFVCSDEREKERERHRPNFDIEIHQVVFAGDQPPSHAMHIAVEMTIHNSGADSAARTWSPIVEFMDGHRNFFTEAALNQSGGVGGANLLLNTATIPRNGKQRGWLQFSATCSGLYDPRNPQSGLDEIKKVTICVSDYMGGTYEHIAHAHRSSGISMDELFRTRKTRVR